MEERGETGERSRTGLIKGKKKNECGVGAGKRTIINKDKIKITLMLIPLESLEQIIKYIISEVLGKWGP